MHTIEMPKLGDTIDEGKVLCWHKLVGEPVQRDEPLVEIETDKINIEMVSTASGVVRAVFAEGGETVLVGSVLALVGEIDEALPESLEQQPVEVRQRCIGKDDGKNQSPVRRYGRLVFNGVFGVVTVVGLVLLLKGAPYTFWLGAGLMFLVGGSLFFDAILEHVEQSRREQETNEEPPCRLHRLHFHQKMAGGIFWVGMGVMQLSSRLIHMEIPSFLVTLELLGLTGGIMLVGGGYWLTVQAMLWFRRSSG